MKKVLITLCATISLVGVLGFSGQSFAKEKYYGNGVYCGKHTCHVNWGQAWGKIIRNSANNLVSGGNYGWH